MEKAILTFATASSTPPAPAAAAFLRRSAPIFSESHNNCRQSFSISPTGNSRSSRNTTSGRSRGNLSLKALNHSLSSNWDVSNYAAPLWLPSLEELDTTNMLLRQRIVFLGSPIDDMTADFVISQLLLLDSEDKEKDIKLFIHSPGGSNTAGMGIYDAMKFCKADVSTVCVGIAASMAAFLLASGTKGKRFCMPNSRVMIHQPKGTVGGSIADMSLRVKELYYQTTKQNKILSRITGKPEEQIDDDSARDYFMNAWEAKDYGLVDAVIDDGKPGLVAPTADSTPPPFGFTWIYWKIGEPETATLMENLPSEEKLAQNETAVEQGNTEDKGSEQKEEVPTSP